MKNFIRMLMIGLSVLIFSNVSYATDVSPTKKSDMEKVMVIGSDVGHLVYAELHDAIVDASVVCINNGTEYEYSALLNPLKDLYVYCDPFIDIPNDVGRTIRHNKHLYNSLINSFSSRMFTNYSNYLYRDSYRC